MQSIVRWLLAAALAGAAGCSSTPSGTPDPTPDATGAAADGGAVGPDGAATADAGPPGPIDASPADAREIAPPSDAGPHQLTFDELFRAFRLSLDMEPVEVDPFIRQAAANHCWYCFNNPTDCGLRESRPTGVGFTGEHFWDRLLAAGFTGEAFIEVLSYFSNPEVAFQSWVDSLYHRIPLVSYLSSAYGYGDGPGCTVADFARATPADPAARSTWPLDGAAGVPVALAAEFPEYMPGPLGYPISLHAGGVLEIAEHTLETAAGDEVAHHLVDEERDPNNYVTAYEVYVVPAAPLEADTTYRVTLIGLQAGAAFEVSWTFTTESD